jgi:hypothetical protein
MKVIIQDAKTKRFFSDDGRWVADEEDAKDFISLMRAYHFAKQFTSGRFEVLLYCPDDNYRKSMIEGEGAGGESFGETASCTVVEKAGVKTGTRKKAGESTQWSRFNACMTSTRNYLN